MRTIQQVGSSLDSGLCECTAICIKTVDCVQELLLIGVICKILLYIHIRLKCYQGNSRIRMVFIEKLINELLRRFFGLAHSSVVKHTPGRVDNHDDIILLFFICRLHAKRHLESIQFSRYRFRLLCQLYGTVSGRKPMNLCRGSVRTFGAFLIKIGIRLTVRNDRIGLGLFRAG